MSAVLNTGLYLHCYSLLKHSEPEEKTASSLLDLPESEITEEILPLYMGQLGNELAKNAEAVTNMLIKSASNWYKGYTDRLTELGVDFDSFEKNAQAFGGYPYMPDVMAGGRRYLADAARQGIQQYTEAPQDQRIVGDTSDLFRAITPDALKDKWLGSKGLDMATYFIPGVGTVRTALDAGSDFVNMFGKGLDWKQRLGYGLSGLMNAGMTALDIFTLGIGGRLGSALWKGGKALLKGSKGASKLGKGLAAAGSGIRKGRTWMRQGLNTMAGKGGLTGLAGKTMRRGTDFGAKTRNMNFAQQQAANASWLGRRWAGAKDMGKTMAGGMAMNMPFIAPMVGAQLMTMPQMGQAQQEPIGYNYGSGSHLGFNSVGRGYQNQVGGRFPQGQSF